MKSRSAITGWIFLAALVFLSAAAMQAGGEEAGSAAGWEEGPLGRWSARPERKVEIRDDVFRTEATLSPGTAVSWEKKGNRELHEGEVFSIEMMSAGTNRTSRDYDRYKAHFPLSVTVVFGKDSLSLPVKRRVADFFRGLWHGFSPGGIRLTYAYGNHAPVGAMYRLGEEETVFIVAGEEEVGKRIKERRNLRNDFRAAYGRSPKGPVTRIRVAADRPSGESGSVAAEIFLEPPPGG